MATPYKLYYKPSATDSGAPSTDGVAVTGTNVYYSNTWGGNDAAGYDLQVFWTGTPTGTFVLQVADKERPNEASDADWTTSTEVTVVNPAGSASNFRVAFAGTVGRHRLKYTNATGSGTLTGYVIVAKQHLGN